MKVIHFLFIAFFLQAVPNFMRPALKSINSYLWLSKGSSLKKKKNSLLVNRNCILRWFKWNQHCTHLFFLFMQIYSEMMRKWESRKFSFICSLLLSYLCQFFLSSFLCTKPFSLWANPVICLARIENVSSLLRKFSEKSGAMKARRKLLVSWTSILPLNKKSGAMEAWRGLLLILLWISCPLYKSEAMYASGKLH